MERGIEGPIEFMCRIEKERGVELTQEERLALLDQWGVFDWFSDDEEVAE